MEVVHRFFANGDEPFRRFLDKLDVPYKYEESLVGKTVLLLISENHEKWPVLARAYRQFDVFHSSELRFSKQELSQAEWLQLGVTSHFGYPQPEDDFAYRSSTYRPGSVCECGIGGEQVAPFRFRKVPSQTRSQLLQLNWVFDEYQPKRAVQSKISVWSASRFQRLFYIDRESRSTDGFRFMLGLHFP